MDHSACSVRAAETAANIARQCGAELVLLTAVEYPDSPAPEIARAARHYYPQEPVELVADAAAHAKSSLLGKRLTETFGVPVGCVVTSGAPADTIVSFADREGIDLIAMGHTGHSQLVTLVLGSVARRVIDTANCPVLIVR
jgi:nucleotide-binding universal stress UspA family protein